LGADSLDVMEICIALESLFDIEIEADQAHAFRTVFDIASFLGRRVVAPRYQMMA
jgi:acyl carrier protein